MGVIRDNRTQIVAGGLISASYVSDVYNVLTGNTVENVAFSGSVNITGSLIADLTGTASYAEVATTASYSIVTTNVVTSSSFADSATSASYAVTASYITNSIVSTTVTVTAAELIAAGAPPVIVKELLPTPGAGKYYKISQLILKYKNATIPWNTNPACSLTTSSGDSYNPNATIGIAISFGSIDEGLTGYFSGISPRINESLNFKFNFGSAITSGDGDLIFEIEYEILDF